MCITTETQTLHAPVPVSVDYTGMFNTWLSIRKRIWNQYMKRRTLWEYCRICCCTWLLRRDGWSCVQRRQSWQLHGWSCVQRRQSWQFRWCFCNLMGHQSYTYPWRPDILQGHMQHILVEVDCCRGKRLSEFRRMIKHTRNIICSKIDGNSAF